MMVDFAQMADNHTHFPLVALAACGDSLHFMPDEVYSFLPSCRKDPVISTLEN